MSLEPEQEEVEDSLSYLRDKMRGITGTYTHESMELSERSS